MESTSCCAGTAPETREDVDSLMHKMIVLAAQTLLRQGWFRPLTILLYIVYLCVAIWGALHFNEGVLIQQVSHEDSTFYKHSIIVLEDYKLEMLVSFDIMEPLDYSSPSVQANMDNLVKNAKADYLVRNDFHVSWFDAYKQADIYNDSSELAFVTNLKEFIDRYGFFRNDVIFNENITKVISSRFYVRAEGTKDWMALSDLMVRLRKVGDTNPLPVITFAPHFIYYAQLATIMNEMKKILIFSAVAMFIVSLVLMPHPVVAVLTTCSVASMAVGLLGFMYYMDLSINSITILLLVLNIGFSIDYSIHVIQAFLQAEGKTRKDKIETAIEMAGAPMCNGAFLTFVGVVLLAVSESYIFFTFFRIISVMVVLGVTHTLVILPIALLVLGPFEDPVKQGRSPSMERITRTSMMELSSKSESVSNRHCFSRQLSNTSVFSIPRAKINPDTSNEPGMPDELSYY